MLRGDRAHRREDQLVAVGQVQRGQLAAEQSERPLGDRVEHLRQRRPAGQLLLHAGHLFEDPLPFVQGGQHAQRPQREVQHPGHAAQQQHLLGDELVGSGPRHQQPERVTADVQRDDGEPAVADAGQVHPLRPGLCRRDQPGHLLVAARVGCAEADDGRRGTAAEQHTDLGVQRLQDAFHRGAQRTGLVGLLGQYREELHQLRRAPRRRMRGRVHGGHDTVRRFAARVPL